MDRHPLRALPGAGQGPGLTVGAGRHDRRSLKPRSGQSPERTGPRSALFGLAPGQPQPGGILRSADEAPPVVVQAQSSASGFFRRHLRLLSLAGAVDTRASESAWGRQPSAGDTVGGLWALRSKFPAPEPRSGLPPVHWAQEGPHRVVKGDAQRSSQLRVVRSRPSSSTRPDGLNHHPRLLTPFAIGQECSSGHFRGQRGFVVVG